MFVKDLFRKLRENDVGYLYVVKVGENFKVGTSTLPEQRIQLIRTDNALPLEVLCIQKLPFVNEWEKLIHEWLRTDGYHVRGEWYKDSSGILELLLEEIESFPNGMRPELLELMSTERAIATPRKQPKPLNRSLIK